MISSDQIKAARTMLHWSQDELAKASGLSPKTVYKLEAGYLSTGSTSKIRKTLENEGFEFFGDCGLNRRASGNRIYDGANGPDEFFKDMLATAKEKDGEIAAIFDSLEVLERALGITHLNNLERLKQLSKFSNIKCLFSEFESNFLDTPTIQFRVMRQPLSNPQCFFTCGHKHCIIYHINGKDFLYIVMNSIESASLGRKNFQSLWNTALPQVVKVVPAKRTVRA